MKRIAISLAISMLILALVAESKPEVERRRRDNHGHQNGHHGHHGPVKHWGYRNEDKNILPRDWHKNHPKCVGQQQSPINIDTEKTEYNENLEPIVIHRSNHVSFEDDNSREWFDDGAKETWSVKNNGHTLLLTPINKVFKIQLTPEMENFRLLQMHFHWRGSEHTLNDVKFAGELHLVHQSLKNSKRFAVLGFLIELGQEDNKDLAPIIDEIKNIQVYNKTSQTEPIELENILPTKVFRYYRYSGSLTTPACDEIVTWLVVDSPLLTISEDQLLEMQSLQDHHGYPILTNSRPVQELFDREVLRSFTGLKQAERARFIEGSSDPNGANSLAFSSFFQLTTCLLASTFVYKRLLLN